MISQRLPVREVLRLYLIGLGIVGFLVLTSTVDLNCCTVFVCCYTQLFDFVTSSVNILLIVTTSVLDPLFCLMD